MAKWGMTDLNVRRRRFSPKAYFAEGVDLRISAEGVDLRPQLDLLITFDSDVLRRRFKKRSKAESEGFPISKESASEDIAIESYGDFELVS